jgi:hypothetical protein
LQSNGDSKSMFRKGYSQYGDYVFGWRGNSLQRAMDTRSTGGTRKDLKTQTVEEVMKCIKSQVVKVDIGGYKLQFLTVLGSP